MLLIRGLALATRKLDYHLVSRQLPQGSAPVCSSTYNLLGTNAMRQFAKRGSGLNDMANHIWQQNDIKDKNAVTNKMGGAYVILNLGLTQKQIKSQYPPLAPSSFLVKPSKKGYFILKGFFANTFCISFIYILARIFSARMNEDQWQLSEN